MNTYQKLPPIKLAHHSAPTPKDGQSVLTEFSPAVIPEVFAREFARVWTSEFGNKSSPEFFKLWCEMARAFNVAMMKSDPKVETSPDVLKNFLYDRRELDSYLHRWIGFPAVCGSGKSTGSALYLALFAAQLQAALSDPSSEYDDLYTPGALYVCRTVEQAEEIVGWINGHFERFADQLGLPMDARKCAIARHSGQREEEGKRHIPKSCPKAEVTRQYPVLVICANGFIGTVEKTADGNKGYKNIWDQYQSWEYGKRALCIVDESLQGTVQSYHLERGTVENLTNRIPRSLLDKFPVEIEVLKALEKQCRKGSMAATQARAARADGNKTQLLHEEYMGEPYTLADLFPDGDPSTVNFTKFEDAVALYWSRRPPRGKPEKAESEDKARTKILRSLNETEGLVRQMIYYLKDNRSEGLNAARLLIPQEYLPRGIVLLDATLDSSTLVEVLGPKRIECWSVPEVRDFSNLKLHVARVTSGAGAESFTTKKTRHQKSVLESRIDQLFDFLDKGNFAGRKVFIATHKKVALEIRRRYEMDGRGWPKPLKWVRDPDTGVRYREEVQTKPKITRPYEVSVGWFNAITGKNQWADHDVVIVFSVYNLPPVKYINLVLAHRGIGAQVREEAHKLYISLSQKHVASETTQAILRGSGRIVSGVEGGRGVCPKCDAYLILQTGEQADEIEKLILRSLGKSTPDCTWNFDFDENLSELDVRVWKEVLKIGSEPVNVDDLLDRANVLAEGDREQAKRYIREPDKALNRKIAAKGFRVVSKRGRYGGTFIERGAETYFKKRKAA